MSDDMAEKVAAVLSEHEYALEMRLGSICLCGFIPTVQPETLQTQQDYHRAHLADALLPLIREREAAAWDEGYGDDLTCTEPRENPYRAALDGADR